MYFADHPADDPVSVFVLKKYVIPIFIHGSLWLNFHSRRLKLQYLWREGADLAIIQYIIFSISIQYVTLVDRFIDQVVIFINYGRTIRHCIARGLVTLSFSSALCGYDSSSAIDP